MVAKTKTKTKTERKTKAPAKVQRRPVVSLPEEGLGERVRSLRARLGLTHDGLSDLTKIADQEGRGISRTSIRGYELGTYKPGARELRILSLSLEVTPTWLLFGNEEDPKTASRSAASRGEKSDRKPRWADIVFPLISLSQIGSGERDQIVNILETLYRLQIGEVRFRSLKAFVNEFCDIVQDGVRDHSERQDLSKETLKKVFFDTVADMKKRHGDEEAAFMMAALSPFIEHWVSKI